ncbi:L-fucose mutarotase [Reichenbachiella sp. MALMAid0571]|uniref:L-fucose mutarotase n=1 Tax=Reichenbachiella sp. MALMAid0571 TaxID=3143939 RepID=UPI0032DECC13
MLKGIPKIISPDLLYVLACMGHGDEIVLADANFPGESLNGNVIRCEGLEITDLLKAILPLFPLDQSVNTPWFMMKPTDSKNYDDQLESSYHHILKEFESDINQAEKIERFDFYQRASEAFVVVMSGTTKRFGNVILKKGTIFL